ncbi:MAG: hypothetical protein VB036_05505, partial [Propionicimonas sp.]|nr:hypothetical protein [Propionicimonas sp.]
VMARVAFVGEGGDVRIEVSQQIIHKQLVVIGSWVFGVYELGQIVQYVANHDIDLESLVTDVFDIEDAQKAFEIADGAASGKVVITMGGGN